MALQQDTKKTAVLAFGRMNPPTTGHEKLINKTHEVAKKHGGTAHVVASHSNDKKKNPLPQDKKLGYIRKIAHPDVKVSGSSTGNSGPLHAATKLHDAGHKHLVYVGGSDQHKNIHKVLTKYNGKKGAHGHYNFKSIKSVSAGDRNDKASGTEGMSASKMRDHAKAGRHKEFKQGLPKALHPHAKEIHGHIGGTQLESFKEAVMKKKFKPSGEKTEVITHTMPQGGKGVGVKNGSGGKGAPANTTRSGGQRFGEGKDQYMRMVNAEFEDFTGDSLDEVLSRQARIKKALILRRFKHKIQRKKAMMRKKLATAPMLKRRARRHAIKLVRKRFMGKKGENYAKLGMADKIMIDTRVATKKAIIDRIAQRLLPKVRRAELVRLRDYKKNKQAAAKKPSSNKKFTPAPAKKQLIVKYKGPPPTSSTQQAVKTSSYAIPKNVKTESYVTEDNVIQMVDMLSILTEKDQQALERKINSSDIDNNILFEVFAMGLDGEGPQTPQQQGFMSLNTFMADDYQSQVVAEQREKNLLEAQAEYQDLFSEAMRDWDGEEISGVQLDRRFGRPILAKSSLNRLKEFKATGERSDVEDPIDPKTVTHDIIDKDPKTKKRKKKKEITSALEYPHGTNKAYRKDTPGQKNEDTNVKFTDFLNELDTSTLQSYKRKASDASKHKDITTKKVDNRYSGVSKASKELEKRNNKRLQDRMLQQIAVKKRHLAQRAAAQSRGSNVQNEDAAAMMRVKQAQANQKDRIRQAFEKEMEGLNNTDAKKTLKDKHERQMQGLKQRQQARQDQARARLPR